MPDSVDQTARDEAAASKHAIANFRSVVDGQFQLINQKIDLKHTETDAKIDRIESAIKWAGGLIVSLVLAVLGWSVLQQINANEAQKKELAQQVQLLQQQERAREDARSEILSRLPPGAAQPTGTPSGAPQVGDQR